MSDLGSKFDNNKAPLSMIPRSALEFEAQVFKYGANKYGKNNWKQGLSYSRLIDAALRHILAFAEKENQDFESGLPHLAHARASLAMLIENMSSKLGTDDR